MNMFTFIDNLSSPVHNKAGRTRERILQAALTLFETNGYDNTTMRQIAAESDSSLGLAYRYFNCKEEFVLAFYESLAEQFIAQIPALPQGKIPQRFSAAMEAKFALIEPHRELIGLLLSSALNPGSRVAVLGDASAGVRKRMQGAFEQLVRMSEDAPGDDTSTALGKLLYVAHLGLLYFRVNDRSENGRATRELLAWLESALSYLPLVSRIPLFSEGLLKLAASLDAVFGGHANEHTAE